MFSASLDSTAETKDSLETVGNVPKRIQNAAAKVSTLQTCFTKQSHYTLHEISHPDRPGIRPYYLAAHNLTLVLSADDGISTDNQFVNQKTPLPASSGAT